MLSIPRNLDLDLEADREILLAAAQGSTFAGALVRSFLGEYLSLFPEKHWRIVQGGVVGSRPESRGKGWVLEIEHAIDVARALSRLTRFSGFESLKAGLRNPTQVGSTLFEIMVAEWCSDRNLSEGLEFSPEVPVRGSIKRPEFRWRTKLGDIYCECKQAGTGESKIAKRARRLQVILENARKAHEPWDDALRLDVEIDNMFNGIEKRIEHVVNQLFKSQVASEAVQEGEVRAMLRRREEPTPASVDVLKFRTMPLVAKTATRMADVNASITLIVSLAKHREEATAKLVRDARSQLPPDAPGAVFIQGVGLGRGLRRLQNLLQGATTPVWGSIWDLDGPRAFASRDGQPFDLRLAEPTPLLTVVPA